MYDNVVVHIISYALHVSFVVNNHIYIYIYIYMCVCVCVCRDDEGTHFMTFVRRSLYPWGIMLQRTKSINI
jgi:hypothetical protein